MRNGVCFQRERLAHHIDGIAAGSLLEDGWATPTGQDSVGSGMGHATKASGRFAGTLTDQTVRDPKVRMWGTPLAQDDQKSPEAHMATKDRLIGPGRTEVTSLTVQTKMPENWKDWPTPVASEAFRGTDPQRGPAGGSKGLKHAATQDWSTPKARDGKDTTWNPGQAARKSPDLPAQATDPMLSGLPSDRTPTDGESGSVKVDLNPHFVESLMGVPKDWLTPSTSVGTDSYQRWLRRHLPNWRLVLVPEEG
jgi:hypothetical protein